MEFLTDQDYRNYAQSSKNLPVFFQPWWLDILFPEGQWQAIAVGNEHMLQGCFVYSIKKYGPFKVLQRHTLTPYFGLWLEYPEKQKYSTKLAYEKKIVDALIQNLPPFDHFSINFPPEITNWLPFYWNNFSQTTKYTYRIYPPIPDEEQFSRVRENIRREIKKAQKRVEVSESNDLVTFYDLHKMTFQRQNKKPHISWKLFQNIAQGAFKYQAGRLLLARDSANQVHAGIFLIWDNHRIYYLLGGADPAFRNSGAQSLLIWEGIRKALRENKIFDFEGSMLEPVERFFSAFGAHQVPYHKIIKTPNPIIKSGLFLKSIFSGH